MCEPSTVSLHEIESCTAPTVTELVVSSLHRGGTGDDAPITAPRAYTFERSSSLAAPASGGGARFGGTYWLSFRGRKGPMDETMPTSFASRVHVHYQTETGMTEKFYSRSKLL